MLNDVPHIDIQNDDDIEGKLDDLVSKIKGKIPGAMWIDVNFICV